MTRAKCFLERNGKMTEMEFHAALEIARGGDAIVWTDRFETVKQYAVGVGDTLDLVLLKNFDGADPCHAEVHLHEHEPPDTGIRAEVVAVVGEDRITTYYDFELREWQGKPIFDVSTPTFLQTRLIAEIAARQEAGPTIISS